MFGNIPQDDEKRRLKTSLNIFKDYFHVHAPNYSLRADENKLWLTPEFSFVCAQANPIRIIKAPSTAKISKHTGTFLSLSRQTTLPSP